MQLSTQQNLKKTMLYGGGLLLTLFAGLALAGGDQDLKGISERVTEQLGSVATLLTYVAYVAGIGFCLAGIVQFKAHKDNPVQVPLSKPIVYLVVGVGLLFLPTIMGAGGSTIFSDKQQGSDYAGGDQL